MHYQGRLKKLSDGLLHETRQNPFYDEIKENGYKNKKSQIVCRVCVAQPRTQLPPFQKRVRA